MTLSLLCFINRAACCVVSNAIMWELILRQNTNIVPIICNTCDSVVSVLSGRLKFDSRRMQDNHLHCRLYSGSWHRVSSRYRVSFL